MNQQPQNRPRVEIVPARSMPASEETEAEIESRRPADASPVRSSAALVDLKVLAGGMGFAVAILVASALILNVNPAPAPFAAVAEVDAPTADHHAALDRLVAEGLPASGVTIRDWAEVDGDGVYANGVPVHAVAAPTPVGLAPGVVTLTAFAGAKGCITLEVEVPGRLPYVLCLHPGLTTPAIPVR